MYSIKELEELSGIKAHTLRIWEQRYQLFQPERTSSNFRIYNENELKKLLNISLLYKNGLKIGLIAALSTDELLTRIHQLSDIKLGKYKEQITELSRIIYSFDTLQFRTYLDQFANKYGIDEVIDGLICSLFEHLTIEWQLNNVHQAHEVFAKNLVKEFLTCRIREIKSENYQAQGIALIIPGIANEIDTLLKIHLLQSNGCNINLFTSELSEIEYHSLKNTLSPKLILCSFNQLIQPEKQLQLLKDLSKSFNKSDILFSETTPTKHVAYSNNVIYLHSVESLKNYISIHT